MDGRLIIAGQRIETPERVQSNNPATLESLGKFYLGGPAECRAAVRAAREAFPVWRDLPPRERRRCFRGVKQALLSRLDEAAELITREKGGPINESLAVELFTSLEIIDYHIHKGSRSLRSRPADSHVFLFHHKRSTYNFQPLGPTLIISPWNYPFLIPFYDMMSALAAGNTLVLRPSSSTALTGLLLGEIFLEAGLPPGVINVVPCKTAQAESLVTHPDIRTVMFTGSTGVGRRIMELASRNLTNITLELGGKDPMIVCRDADLERAARGAVWGAFTNTGQSCGSVERLYVVDDVADAFIGKVVETVKSLKVGDPLDPNNEIGSMTTFPQLTEVEKHIRDAVSKGADLLCGGERDKSLPGYFLRPAVLSGVDHSMLIMREETFGPTLPIMRVSDEDQAVALANDSSFGLTASVWTRSRSRARRMAERLEAGSVTVNDHMSSFSEPSAIWGGIKHTGVGRSHGPYGLLELVNIKYTSFDFHRKRNLLWWYPYDGAGKRLFQDAMTLYHDKAPSRRAKALRSLLPRLPVLLSRVPMGNLLQSLGRFYRS